MKRPSDSEGLGVIASRPGDLVAAMSRRKKLRKWPRYMRILRASVGYFSGSTDVALGVVAQVVEGLPECAPPTPLCSGQGAAASFWPSLPATR
jgi:hypothetical protein